SWIDKGTGDEGRGNGGLYASGRDRTSAGARCGGGVRAVGGVAARPLAPASRRERFRARRARASAGRALGPRRRRFAVESPRARGDVDPAALKDSVPYPLLLFVVQQLPVDGAPPPPGAPRRWPAPELGDGPHLSYAIQWFSFAVIIAFGSAALLRKRGAPG